MYFTGSNGSVLFAGDELPRAFKLLHLALGRVEDGRPPVFVGEPGAFLDHEEGQVSEDSLPTQTGAAQSPNARRIPTAFRAWPSSGRPSRFSVVRRSE